MGGSQTVWDPVFPRTGMSLLCTRETRVYAMNITRENFEATFETICEAIRSSHFIALDAEFTGESRKCPEEAYDSFELSRVWRNGSLSFLRPKPGSREHWCTIVSHRYSIS